MVKTILRLLTLVLMISGWAVAALCVHVVRTPDANDANSSKLVVIPKDRLGINDTYVDARGWTAADVPNHATLIRRVIESGKSDQFKYLTDQKSKEDPQAQLSDELKEQDAADHQAAPEHSKEHHRPATHTSMPGQMRMFGPQAISADTTETTAPAKDASDDSVGFKISF